MPATARKSPEVFLMPLMGRNVNLVSTNENPICSITHGAAPHLLGQIHYPCRVKAQPRFLNLYTVTNKHVNTR